MSWDISIQDLPRNAHRVQDIPHDYQPKPLGPREEVIRRILEVVPDVNFSDPSWGLLDDPCIEFNMGRDETCDSFMLHVRSSNAVDLIARLLDHLQLRGLDCQTGDFFSVEAAEASFGDWKAFRDRVVQKTQDEASDL